MSGAFDKLSNTFLGSESVMSADPGQQGLDKIFGTSAAKDAAKASERAAGKATEAQLEMFYKALDLQQPFIDFGQSNLPAIQQIIGRGESAETTKGFGDLQGLFSQLNAGPNADDPGFAFREKQLNEQLDRRLAGSGKLDSRQGLDVIREGNLALSADEADRQLSRLSQKIGLTAGNIEQQQSRENIPYQRLLDSIRISQGTVGDASAQSVNTGGSLASIFTNQGNQAAMLGQSQSNNTGTALGLLGLFL